MPGTVKLDSRIYDFDDNITTAKELIDKFAAGNNLLIEINYYQSDSQGVYYKPAAGRVKHYNLQNPAGDESLTINKDAFEYAKSKGARILALNPAQGMERHNDFQEFFKTNGLDQKQFKKNLQQKYFDKYEEKTRKSPAYKADENIINKEIIMSQEQNEGDYDPYDAQYMDEYIDPEEHFDDPEEKLQTFYERVSERIEQEKKDDVVKHLSKSPAKKADENKLIKEKIMPQEPNSGERTFRPSLDAAEKVAMEEAIKNAYSQRKTALAALNEGTLSCLPGSDGLADTNPAVNLVNGSQYHGANLLYLKDHQKQNGFPTAEYATESQIDNAKKDIPGLSILPGQNPKFIHWEEKNEQTGNWERQSVKVFNVAQLNNPEEMKNWAGKKQQEKIQKDIDYMKTKWGPNYQPPEPKQKSQGPMIECTSTDPEKYLGQYFAAVSLGGKFKASPEQAAEFSQKLEGALTEKKENGYPDTFKFSKIGNAANQYSKDVEREFKIFENKEEYKQNRKQEQEQSIGRGL